MELDKAFRGNEGPGLLNNEQAGVEKRIQAGLVEYPTPRVYLGVCDGSTLFI